MTEANRDEALKCAELSRRFHAQQEYKLAVKYAEKAVKLHNTSESVAWLKSVSQTLAGQPLNDKSPEPTESTPLNEAKSRRVSTDDQKPAYTQVQVEEVKRFLLNDKNDFYAVLGVPRTADDVEIKKAYRKLALQFHPDKNAAPGADEAFKIVSRAFSCLSDAEKKGQYDRFGSEEAAPSGFSGFNGGVRFRQNAGRYAQNFEADISPEELFNLFFGGMQSRGGGFAFNAGQSPFAPMFVHHFYDGGQRRRRAQQAQEPPTTFLAIVLQLIPVMIIGFFLFLSSFGPSGTATDTWEKMSKHVSLSRTGAHIHLYSTNKLHVPYYGTEDFRSYFKSPNPSRGLQRERQVFEEAIERQFVSMLQQKCREEERDLQRRRANAKDREELESLQKEKAEACERLHSLGINREN